MTTKDIFKKAAYDSLEKKCWEVKTENYRLTGSRKGVPLSRARRNKKFTKIIHMIYINKEGKIREGKRK